MRLRERDVKSWPRLLGWKSESQEQIQGFQPSFRATFLYIDWLSANIKNCHHTYLTNCLNLSFSESFLLSLVETCESEPINAQNSWDAHIVIFTSQEQTRENATSSQLLSIIDQLQACDQPHHWAENTEVMQTLISKYV